MPTLTVPAPTLAFEPAAPGVAMLEKPIELRSAPVTLPDGTALGPAGLAATGFLLYRRAAPAVAPDVWDDAARSWKSTAAVGAAGLQPFPFAFLPDEPQPWFNVVVAAGQKDAGGADRFARAVLGYPRYFFRTHFVPRDDGAAAASSAPTAELQFVGVADTVRAGIAAGPGETLENATELHLFLRNAALQLVGAASIYNEGGQARLELAKYDGAAAPVARLALGADGRITLNDSLQIEASGGNATLSCTGTLRLDASAVRATNFLPI